MALPDRPRRVGRCAGCGFDWDTPPAELLTSLADVMAKYRAAVSEADGLGERPRPDVWSPLEYLAHLRDVTEFYRDRIERVLTEDRPVLNVGVRFAELAELRSYRTEDPIAVLDSLEQRTAEVVGRLRLVEEDEWSRVGIGSQGDERTLLDLARRLAHETQHHLVDMGDH